MKATHKLSDAQKADLVARYVAGESTTVLGRDFGITAPSVVSILDRRGIPRRRRSDYFSEGVEMRVCATCLISQPVTKYQLDSRYPGRRVPQCNRCKVKVQRERLARKQEEFRSSGATALACRDCGTTKPLSEFNASPSTPTGYFTRCRPCHRAFRGDRDYRRDTPDEKTCARCEQRLPIARFSERNSRDGRSPYCLDCEALRRAEHYEREKEIVRRWRAGESEESLIEEFRQRTGRRLAIIRTMKRRMAGRIANAARNRVKGECDLTAEWVLERFDSGCEATGLPFDFRTPYGPFVPSLDRIEAGGPYTQANCRLVCNTFNKARSNWSDADVLRMAQALVARHEAEQKHPRKAR